MRSLFSLEINFLLFFAIVFFSGFRFPAVRMKVVVWFKPFNKTLEEENVSFCAVLPLYLMEISFIFLQSQYHMWNHFFSSLSPIITKYASSVISYMIQVVHS